MRISKRALALVAATVLSPVAITACGEDAQFIDDYNKATEPLQKLNTDIGGAVNSDAGDPAAVALIDSEKITKAENAVAAKVED